MTRSATLILVLTAGSLTLSGCCCGPCGESGGSSCCGSRGIGGTHIGGPYVDGPGVTSDYGSPGCCDDTECGSGCGCNSGCGCGCGGPLDWIFSWKRKSCAEKFCGAGCGDVYWSDWHNHPPDYCDPCDNCGNFVGCGCGCGHNWWKDLVFDKLAWFRCDCGGCDYGCDTTGCGCDCCSGGSGCCGAGIHGGVSSSPAIIEDAPPAVEEILEPVSLNRRRHSAARYRSH